MNFNVNGFIEAINQKNLSNQDIVDILNNKYGIEVTLNGVKSYRRKGGKNAIPSHEKLVALSDILDVSIDFLLKNENKYKVKTIPLIGKASCGIPIKFYNDDIEQIPVSDNIARDGVYAITAEGDSMLQKIKHGDIIICDKEMLCENGNIVHYTTIDGDSGIKKFSCNPITEQVTLMPLNTDYEPIILHREDVKCARCFKIMSDL